MIRFLALFAAGVLSACSGISTKTEMNKAQTETFASRTGQVCLLAGSLPDTVQVVSIGKIKASKGTYGSTNELMPQIANEARFLGADAVIDLQAKQKFRGPLPWRVTSPSGIGTAVRFVDRTATFDCLLVGGKLF